MENKARIWFFTDFHGSNSCFNKFLNLVKNENKPNVLIIGADLTGKQIVPLVEAENETFIIPLGGKEIKKKISEKDELKKSLADIGYYPYECSFDEYKKFNYSDKLKNEIFEKLAKERLEEWIKLADLKLPDSEVCQVIVNAGNDDPFFIDPLLDSSKKLIRGEGKVLNLPANLKLLSTGYTTKTPWPCPREVSEDKLKVILSDMTDCITSTDKLLFNFHCPPYNTSLDLANNLDNKTFKKLYGKKHVGSKSIREAIEYWQPIASLHGHIHEVSTKELLNKTICYNPGSDYLNGKLQGVFLQINSDGIIEFEMLTSEKVNDKSDKESTGIIKTIIKALPFVGSFYKDYISSKKQNEVNSKLETVSKDIEKIKQSLNK